MRCPAATITMAKNDATESWANPACRYSAYVAVPAARVNACPPKSVRTLTAANTRNTSAICESTTPQVPGLRNRHGPASVERGGRLCPGRPVGARRHRRRASVWCRGRRRMKEIDEEENGRGEGESGEARDLARAARGRRDGSKTGSAESSNTNKPAIGSPEQHATSNRAGVAARLAVDGECRDSCGGHRCAWNPSRDLRHHPDHRRHVARLDLTRQEQRGGREHEPRGTSAPRWRATSRWRGRRTRRRRRAWPRWRTTPSMGVGPGVRRGSSKRGRARERRATRGRCSPARRAPAWRTRIVRPGAEDGKGSATTVNRGTA